MERHNLTGYSEKINDPEMGRYVKNSNRYSGIFAFILAVAAVSGFYIYGETSDEMENPEALYIGFTIGSMFLLIALFQIIGRYKSKTWDGTVVDKKVRQKRRHDKFQNRWLDYQQFTVCIKADNGKIHYTNADDDDTQYNYYNLGDKVRHHKGLNSYEKYDKSKDSIIFCNACASLNDINEDYCFRCKCPLLK